MTIILPYNIAQLVAGLTSVGNGLAPRAIPDFTFGMSEDVLTDPAHAVWRDVLSDPAFTRRAVASTEWGPALGPAPSSAINPVLPGVFTAADATRLPFRVRMQSRPPVSNNESPNSFAYWPGTDFASLQNSLFLTTTATVKCWHWNWACRVFGGGLRPNPISPVIKLNGVECRNEFTSIEKAIAATKVGALCSLGLPFMDVANAAGIQAVPQQVLAANPADYFKYDVFADGVNWRTSYDVAFLPTARVIDAPYGEGILLDYEVQDFRTENQTADLALFLASACHSVGKKFSFYTNPLNGATAAKSALTAGNLPTIHASADFISPMTYNGVPEGVIPSLNLQLGLLGPNMNPAKVSPTLGIGVYPRDLTLSIAGQLHDLIIANGFPMVDIWRLFAAQGGDPTVNAILNRLFYGT